MCAGRILGGAELSLLALASRLPEHGWDVVLTCPSGPLADAAIQRGMTVVARPWDEVKPISARVGDAKRYSASAIAASTRTTVLNGARLARMLRATGANAVLSNSLPSHLAVGLAGQLARVPAVWYLREIVDPGPGRRLLDAAGRSATAVLSISHAVSAAMNHPRITTITDPVEPPSIPVIRGARTGRPTVGYLGRLDPRKGVEDICRTASMVDAEFLIAGQPWLAPPAYADQLRSLAAANAPGRVRFLGKVAAPWEFLASVDVLVVPSRREPWGRVAAEALIAGVPVVAANSGGLPEIVRDGVDGFLYAPGDVLTLAEHLRRILSDDALRERLARAAVDGAARFSPDVHTAEVAHALGVVVGYFARTATPCEQ